MPAIRVASQRRRIQVGALLPAAVLWALRGEALLAQGCSMCSTSLQGQADSIVATIQLGILVMLLPPTAIVVAILFALRHRSRPDPSVTGSSPISQDAG